MSAYVALSQTRYAVRRSVSLFDANQTPMGGLLIEVFTQGCRISNVETAGLDIGQTITLRIEGIDDIQAQVHWACDGIVRLRFVRPLASALLRSLTGNSRKRPNTFQPGIFFAA